MKKALAAFIFGVIALWAAHATAAMRFGIYYTVSEKQLNDDYGGREKFAERVKTALSSSYTDIGIPFEVAFIKAIPVSVPYVTYKKIRGVNPDCLFDAMRAHELVRKDLEAVHFLFVISPNIIWNDGYIGCRRDPAVKYENAVGIIDVFSYRMAIVTAQDKYMGNVFLSVYYHELGHLAGLGHYFEEECLLHNFIMCWKRVKRDTKIVCQGDDGVLLCITVKQLVTVFEVEESYRRAVEKLYLRLVQKGPH